MRVYGVGVFLAVTIVEVAVVAGGGHGYVGERQYCLQFVVNRQRVVVRTCNPYLPFVSCGVLTAAYYLAAYLYHVVCYTFRGKHFRHLVHCEALGYGAAVEHYAWVCLGKCAF